MSESPSPDVVAHLLARVESGDAAARHALFAALYDELHRLAEAHLHRSVGPVTLSATTLLHEAYLNIAGSGSTFPDRNRFFGYASRAMRGLIIDYVRHRSARKRGGDLTLVSIEEEEPAAADAGVDLQRLGDALEELSALDPRLAELVDLKFFCGFSFAEIAAMRQVSERTIQRDWAKARTLLHQSLHEG